MKPVTRYRGGFRWQDVALQPYKPEGTHYRDISRQLLFGADSGLGCELRYFEIERDGHSTLERHAHPHAVLILRGTGRVLVGSEVFELSAFDLVSVPPGSWHQFRAGPEDELGFLCLVDRERDRPLRPTAAELRELKADPKLAAFIRT